MSIVVSDTARTPALLYYDLTMIRRRLRRCLFLGDPRLSRFAETSAQVVWAMVVQSESQHV